jgi:adenine-specific DNA-methyltransferase
MFLSEMDSDSIPTTLWSDGDVFGFNQQGVREIRELGFSFATPKPEKLIRSILHLTTAPGDLVLDSFLGSGTTAAVAHKMGRRWIGVELGDHAATHCAPRLRKVIDGEQGGISRDVAWKGGGGFRFVRLGSPVFNADGAINPGIPFPHLAAHVWFSETGSPLGSPPAGTWLGIDEGRGLVLLYNGILGDKSVSGGNVLTAALLKKLRADAGGFTGPLIIYGEASRLGPDRLKAEGVTFKQTPYDVRAR